VKFSLKIILPIFILFLIGCKKDHSILGVDVQPSVDDLNAEHINGLPVTAHTLPYDSIASFDTQYKFIGSNNDPYFGRTDIGIYLNTNIDRTLDFGVNSRITSAEIILAVDPLAFAGDKFASLTYSVFALHDNLNIDSLYYTTDARHHYATPISVYTTSFTVADNAQAIISIKIDSTYAEGLLHDIPNLTDNATFQAKYKGYYIAASLQNNEEGIIYTANLDDDLSGLHLHYRTGPSTSDSLINQKFSFTGSTATRYNTVKFSPIQTLKNQFQDSILGATNLYLKGMGMTKLKVQIPFLVNHSDSFKIAVNRAELVLNIDPGFVSAGRYLTPPKLLLLSIDSIGRESYAQDLLSSTDYSRFDGAYDEANNRYVFNLAREAQLIFSGKKKNRGFYVVMANADVGLTYDYIGDGKQLKTVRRDLNYERVIFAGSSNATLKPQFNLNYIRFKND